MTSEQSGFTRQELRTLLCDADSALSLLRHRCESRIPWDTSSAPSRAEVDQIIGKLRRAYVDLAVVPGDD